MFVRGKERETETGVDSKSVYVWVCVCVYERVIEGWRIRGIVNTFTMQVGTLCGREGGREGGLHLSLKERMSINKKNK